MQKTMKQLSVSILCATVLLVAGCGDDPTTAPATGSTAPSTNLNIGTSKNRLDLHLDLSTLVPQNAATPKALLSVMDDAAFSKVSIVLTHPIKKVRKVVELPVVNNIASGRIDDLVTGQWELEVAIYNQADETVFEANQSIVIMAGQVTKVALEFVPVIPTGSVEIVIVPKPSFDELQWRPDPSVIPASGNYVYLASQSGDYIGQGATYLYTDQQFGFSSRNNMMQIDVNESDDYWGGNFVLPETLSEIKVGLYQGLQRYPFYDAAVGGLDWSGNGRGCNTLNGWIAVDQVTYEAGALKSIDYRFSQHCEGGQPALLGAVHWQAAGLVGTDWQPLPAAVPSAGNYVYLESDRGDYIGGGKQYLYTPSDALVNVIAEQGMVSVGIQGDEFWSADFKLPVSETVLKTGLYQGVQRYPFHNPVKGGLSWSGEGRGCNELSGWFSIDRVEYQADQLKQLDLRFEQNCEGGSSALRGKIHWVKP